MGQKRAPASDQQPAFPIGIGRLDGIRTRITGLKDRHPHILDDKAEKLKRAAGIAVQRPLRRTARFKQDRAKAVLYFAKKNTHRRPSRADYVDTVWTPAGFDADVG